MSLVFKLMYIFQKVTIFTLLLLFTSHSYAGSSFEILILHSYSQEYPWTKNQHQAFIAELDSTSLEHLGIRTEYLDTKRMAFDADYVSFFYQYLTTKYDDYSPDIIYVTDDNALSFALNNFHTLYPNASIFFSGVNNYSIKDSLDRKRVTGVFEKKDILRNLELLDRIDANAKDIVVVGDNSNTYKAIETEIKQQLENHPEINATFLADNSIDELRHKVNAHSSKYLFLTTLGAMMDADGHNLSLDETLSSLSQPGDKIIVSMEDAYVIDGILGGYVTSGEQQGKAAAGLVNDYISGTAVEDLPVISSSPNEYMFNFKSLEAAAITLPEDIQARATILNKPPSFYIRHEKEIIGSIFSLAGILILSLSIFLILLARKNRVIQSTSIQTQELEQIIHERTLQLSDEKQKLIQAQEIAHIGNYTWEVESDKVSWSNELFNIVGRKADEFTPTYNNYVNCIHLDDRHEFTTLTQNVFDGRKKYNAEYRIVRPDGEIRHVHEQGDMKTDYLGNIVSLVGVVHDITERKTSENESLRLQRELNQTYKMEALGQLTGGIAHDFNNILAIIAGYTKLTIENCKNSLEPKILNYLNNIDLATTRATDLVSKMMVFSRDDKGVNEPLSFAPLLEESINMLRSVIPSSIDIEYSFANDLPKIMMDKTQLHQVMMNLAVNAKDAMKGVGKLTITLGWYTQVDKECDTCHKHIDGDWIGLKISDTGTGIEQEVLDRIFEPFYTTKTIGQGTGMGLSVLSAIVEGHGGHILINTKIGYGTTFTLLFPPAESIKQDQPDDKANTIKLEKNGMGQKILIVDDEPALADFLLEVLEINGYDCTVCNQSTDALSLVEKHPERFELVITDQTMPQLLGMDMIKEIWKIKPDIQVILTTGYSDTISREEAENLGVNYLDKPIDVPQLLTKLSELLNNNPKEDN